MSVTVTIYPSTFPHTNTRERHYSPQGKRASSLIQDEVRLETYSSVSLLSSPRPDGILVAPGADMVCYHYLVESKSFDQIGQENQRHSWLE